MAVGRELPEDFAAALDRVPEAGDRFAAMPADRQAQWIDWIERALQAGPPFDVFSFHPYEGRRSPEQDRARRHARSRLARGARGGDCGGGDERDWGGSERTAHRHLGIDPTTGLSDPERAPLE